MVIRINRGGVTPFGNYEAGDLVYYLPPHQENLLLEMGIASLEDAAATQPLGRTVSPAAHISRVLVGAETARRVRPDATYATERWCTPAGAGAHDGTSLANAWSLSELNTALATTGSLHVYMVGTFEPAAYNTAGPLLRVVADNVRLDFATHRAVMRGYTGLTWNAAGVNGEYYASVGTGSAGALRITEDGLRMGGVSYPDAGVARMLTAAIDSGNDTITLDVYRELAVNDLLAWISTNANGLTQGTAYYVKTVTALSSGRQTVTLSTSIGGATVNLTGTTSGYMWSLVGGRDGDPVPGSLEPGQFAWAPHEARIYIKPSWGSPADHTYTFWQTSVDFDFIQAWDGAGTCTAPQIVGGEFYGSIGYAIVCGDNSGAGYVTAAGVYGTVVHGCKAGVTVKGGANCVIEHNVAHDISEYAFGANDVDTAEVNLAIRYNWGYDIGTQLWDEGDSQGCVINAQSNGAEFVGNVIQRLGHVATDENPLPVSGNLNYGTLVVDSSSRVLVAGNYLQDCQGDQVEVGPNNYQDINYCTIAGNVFDKRGIAPVPNPQSGSNVQKGIFVNVTDAATYGCDYTFRVEENLFIFGDVADPPATYNADIGAIYVRNTATNPVNAKCTTRRNVFVFTDPDAPWRVNTLRLRSTRATNTGIDSDWNTYYSANPNVFGQWEIRQTTGSQTPSTTATLASLGDHTGWTSPDGTVSDKHSTVWSAADLETKFATHPTVMRCLLS